MKRVLSLTGILAMAILFTSAVSIDEMPQDPPKGKKGKKHIKMVKVDEDGKKVEIDTVLAVDEVFIWNGDTLGGGKDLKWISEGDFDLDMDMDLDFDVETDEDGNLFVFKGKGKAKPMVYSFKTDNGDSVKQIRMKVISDGDCEDIDIMKWHGEDENEFIFRSPHPAHAPNVIRIDKRKSNVIDLSDPGIISFEKKELRNGNEKIVIVREKPSEEEVEMHQEIMIHGDHSDPVMLHGEGPHKTKQIKVIAGDEGHLEILEDGKVWSVEEMDEGIKVIEKDGRKIIIKKSKDGDKMKVDVEVEEEIHEEHKD